MLNIDVERLQVEGEMKCKKRRLGCHRTSSLVVMNGIKMDYFMAHKMIFPRLV